MVKLSAVLIGLSFIVGCVGPGCASGSHPESAPSTAMDHPIPFENSPNPAQVQKLWAKRMPGKITDISVAQDGNSVLVATAPDKEIPGSDTRHFLSRFDSTGRLLWRRQLDTQLKAQAISRDGSLVVASTYLDQVMAYDQAGNELWEIEGMCRPFILNRSPQPPAIVCYHDDDDEPKVAFDVLDLSGHKTLSIPITRDILFLKPSADGSHLVMGLTGGEVSLFGLDFHALWQRRIGGEIVDLAVSSGSDPKTAVLYLPTPAKTGETQKITVLDRAGKVVAEGRAPFHLDEIELNGFGDAIIGYGNGPREQVVGLMRLPPRPPGSSPLAIREAWHQGIAHPANFSTSLMMTPTAVTVELEDLTSDLRHGHLFAFDFNGKVKAQIPLVTGEGAYNFGMENPAMISDPALLAIGADDGTLSTYRLSRL